MVEPRAFFGVPVFTGSRRAEALLTEDGRITSVGSETEVRRAMPVGTDVIQLRGGLIVPGLIDAHLHLLGTAVRRFGVDLGGSRTVQAIQRRLTRWAEQHPSGPILATGWDDTRLREQRFPTQAELDSASPDRPIVAYRVSGHVAIANSRAEEAAGHRAEAGKRPIGPGVYLEQEQGALDALGGQWLAARPETLRAVLDGAASRGLTAVGAMSMGQREYSSIHSLARRRRFPVYVAAYARIQEWTRFPVRDDHATSKSLHLQGVKAQLDGALGIRTAALERPYSDAAEERGWLRPEVDTVRRDLPKIAARGLQLALHAIGDRAVSTALSLFEPVRDGGPRPRLEHASVLSPELLRRLHHDPPVIVAQPSFAVSDWWLRERIGPARCRWAYCWTDLRALGIPLAGSSDSPVENLDPWRGMRDSGRLRRWTSAAQAPRAVLTPREAFELYSVGGAQALGVADRGHLEVGAHADFLVLGAKSLDAAVRRGSGSVRETWRGAERVYHAAGGTRSVRSRPSK